MLKMSASILKHFAMPEIGEIRKSSHMSAVRHTVYTNPLPKYSFSKTIFLRRRILKNTPALCLNVKGNIENDVTIIT